MALVWRKTPRNAGKSSLRGSFETLLLFLHRRLKLNVFLCSRCSIRRTRLRSSLEKFHFFLPDILQSVHLTRNLKKAKMCVAAKKHRVGGVGVRGGLGSWGRKSRGRKRWRQRSWSRGGWGRGSWSRGVGVKKVGVPDRDTTLLPTLARSPGFSRISPHTSLHLPSHCPHPNTLSTPLLTPQTHFPTPQTHFHTPTPHPPHPNTLPTFPTHLPTPFLTFPHTPTHFHTPSIFPPYLTQLPQPPKISPLPHHPFSPILPH